MSSVSRRKVRKLPGARQRNTFKQMKGDYFKMTLLNDVTRNETMPNVVLDFFRFFVVDLSLIHI